MKPKRRWTNENTVSRYTSEGKDTRRSATRHYNIFHLQQRGDHSRTPEKNLCRTRKILRFNEFENQSFLFYIILYVLNIANLKQANLYFLIFRTY